MKNAHLRRTGLYASLLEISGALHLDVFDRSAKRVLSLGLLISVLEKNPYIPK
jgi:hypothetical protein